MGQKKKEDTGSLEHQIDAALQKCADLTLSLERATRRIEILEKRQKNLELRDTVLSDLIMVVLEVPAEIADMAFKNVLAFSKPTNPIRSKKDVMELCLSRQAALKRLISQYEGDK